MPSLSDMPEIVFDPLPGEALSRFISENVVTVNHARTGISTWYPANFFLKNGRGEYLGDSSAMSGAVGCMSTSFGWPNTSAARDTEHA